MARRGLAHVGVGTMTAMSTRSTSTITVLGLLGLLGWFCLAGCAGSTTPAHGGAGSSAAGSSAAVSSSEADAGTAWRTADPCGLLSSADLKPYLQGTAAHPSRSNSGGKRGCAWGDGEFRSVTVTLGGHENGEPHTSGGKTVAVQGKTAQITGQDSTGCTLVMVVGPAELDLATVSTGGSDWCAVAAKTLGTAMRKLGWS
ncbi:MAG: DUF3558 family protein [Sciscionella sp.]|nr:DUF3558 family protein [Sciscionella sp.]